MTLGVLPTAIVRDMTVSVTTVLSAFDTAVQTTRAIGTLADQYLRTFQTAHTKTINHLSMEFERKKTAALHEKARTSRTGTIDCSKLHAYKFRDDLFKSVTILPNGKSHGVVVLIDGSGSMATTISDTLDQLLMFAQFAKRVNIPFQAYMLGLHSAAVNKYGQEFATQTATWNTPLHQMVPADYKLVQVLDSTQPRWNDQLRFVAAFAAKYDHKFANRMPGADYYSLECLPYSRLGLTPIVSSLLLVEHHIGVLKQSRKLDKMTLIVLTDGENNGMISYFETTATGARALREEYDRTPFVIRDTVTRTTYAQHRMNAYGTLSTDENAVVAALVDSIRRRHTCRVVGLKIVAPRGRRGRSASPTEWLARQGRDLAAPSRLRGDRDQNKTDAWSVTPEQVLSQWHATGQYTFAATESYFDCAVLVSATRLALTDVQEFSTVNTAQMTERKILNAFKTAATSAAANRLFVNAVVPYIA